MFPVPTSAIAKSSFPSPFRSPSARLGSLPVLLVVAGCKVPVPLPKSTAAS